ncbi:MAG: 2-oxoacid:acceptor oxidoreductase family protein [Candidatus Eiseniibacteriota bacterium]|nr:MAG: 2-oxoacid:acceptor oxidoreductase family protein [Candidatus Eisenbacteria bacterium]
MAVEILQKPGGFCHIYERKPGLDKVSTHYCLGCGHGNLHKLIAEALDDMKLADRTILVSPVGCSVFAYYYFDVGNIQAPHGRAPAVATGIKRSRPGSIVMTYQGDGDLAAIGWNNVFQAANRGEHITVFFVNNVIYGMTGSQMAPTTLIGQKTMTTPRGRDPKNEGFPIKVCEVLSVLDAPAYIERVSLADTKSINQTRRAVRKAIKCQADGKGFSMVEVLSPCPTGWRQEPIQAKRWVGEVMTKHFPLGVFKDVISEREPYFFPDTGQGPSLDEVKRVLGWEDDADEAALPEVKPSKENQNPHVKIAGFGGQGILVMGLVLAEAGMRQGYHVSWLPSYGPEMRGGTAHCHVILSDVKVGSPLVSKPTVLIAQNRPSLERFEANVAPGGLILYDSSLIDVAPRRKDVRVLPVPAAKLADELGDTKVSNMVTLGALVEHTGAVSREAVLQALPVALPRKEFVELNNKAVEAGVNYALSHPQNGGRDEPL